MEYQISRWQRWHPCLHISSLSKNRTKILRTKRKRKFHSVETRLELYTHTHTHTRIHIYIYISIEPLASKTQRSSQLQLGFCGQEFAVTGNSSVRGFLAQKLSSCRSNEEISSGSSIFEDFSASCFPNSRCARIQERREGRKGREEVSESAGKVFFEFG